MAPIWAGAFNALRANDLIFSYVVSNWLMGQQPPAFDLLAWNEDSTRLPAAMHSWYLCSCYMENQVANGTMVLGGQRLDLGAVTQDTYVVAAERDHIVPWHSSYQTTRLLAGNMRFVLVSGGHIAGIVSPPDPKAWVMSSNANPPTAEEWRETATCKRESWWEDWSRWMADRAGPVGNPPHVGDRRHPILADGPGSMYSAEETQRRRVARVSYRTHLTHDDPFRLLPSLGIKSLTRMTTDLDQTRGARAPRPTALSPNRRPVVIEAPAGLSSQTPCGDHALHQRWGSVLVPLEFLI